MEISLTCALPRIYSYSFVIIVFIISWIIRDYEISIYKLKKKKWVNRALNLSVFISTLYFKIPINPDF